MSIIFSGTFQLSDKELPLDPLPEEKGKSDPLAEEREKTRRALADLDEARQELGIVHNQLAALQSREMAEMRMRREAALRYYHTEYYRQHPEETYRQHPEETVTRYIFLNKFLLFNGLIDEGHMYEIPFSFCSQINARCEAEAEEGFGQDTVDA